jgi:hypothetical protein
MANTNAKNNGLKILIFRQKKHLHQAVNELEKEGRKVSHWAWWAFPTERPGFSEPETTLKDIPKGKSFITRQTALQLISEAPETWKQVLSKICSLLIQQKSSSLSPVLPNIDHDRVKYFVMFWSSISNKPDWFNSVINNLSKYM